MPTVLHIITGLDNGGAEAALGRLVSEDASNSHQVVSLMDTGFHGERFTAAGVAVHTLDMPRRRLTLTGLRKLYRIIRALDPDVIQTWMYHADLIGGLAARAAGNRAVVWGLRNAYLDPGRIAWSTHLVARLCALVSRSVPYRIVSCSAAGARTHERLGYDATRMVIIPNGYDVTRFAPDCAARGRLRQEWGIGPDTFLMGMVARWDPQKDHATLVAGLGKLRSILATDWRCMLVGPEMTGRNAPLRQLLDLHGVRDRVLLLGPQGDIPGVMNALDLHVLSSAGEAFPNVVAEAMACGTPCVVTDVGDASMIVGPTGWVVPAGDPSRLADAIVAAAQELPDGARRQARQRAARVRIQEEFGIERMASAYRAVWDLTSAGTGKGSR